MTKLPVYASAAALALIATAWATPGRAQQAFGLYTPMPKSASQTPAYDPQHKSSAPSDAKSFGLYTPMPPSAAGQGADRSVSQAPDGRNGEK